MFNDLKVQDWMTPSVVSVSSDTSVAVAQQKMHDLNIRHLPVVDGRKLVGIISLGDLREASPSDATALSIWELNYLWEQLTVEKIMTRSVVVARPDDSIVETLRVMLEHRFGALPVVDVHDQLVGIITEVDIFRMVIGLSERVSPAV
ncbi:MAG: CBS domain-containing protein [bacterium]|nr:CBS domain-containing protein [bacterium]